MIKLLIKNQFKDGFDAVFEHLANSGQGGHVSRDLGRWERAVGDGKGCGRQGKCWTFGDEEVEVGGVGHWKWEV